MQALRPVALLAIATGLFLGCSSEGDQSSSTSAEPYQSWASIQAISMTQLTTGSTIQHARSQLEVLVNDTTLDAAEREYFARMLTALEGKPDDDLIGNTLDDVDCRLK